MRRKIHLLKPDLIIIDEAHHSTAATWMETIKLFSKAKVLGVTATPVRNQGTPLGKSSGGVFEKLITGPQVYELIKNGFLAEFKVYAPPIGFVEKGLKKEFGDFKRSQLYDRLNKKTITGSVIGHYKKILKEKSSIAFCVSIQHARSVAAEFRSHGIPAESIDGTMSKPKRDKIISDFTSGVFKVLTSSELISEGLDIPKLDSVILLRPTESITVYLQQVGRCLRPGKKALIIDHVGNTLRHGFVDEERFWNLERSYERGEKIECKYCEDCDSIFRGNGDLCPECDSRNVRGAGTVKEVEGELKLLTKEELDLMRKKKIEENRNAKTIQDLIKLAEQRGYRNPSLWAKNQIEIYAG